MKRTIISNIALAVMFLASGFVFTSCEKDEFRDHSRKVATNPTITVSAPSTVNETGEDTDYLITLEMSDPQIVDVYVEIYDVEGTGGAVVDEDFGDMSQRVRIPAGSTSVTVPVTIFADCDFEEGEGIRFMIGNQVTANANIAPQEVTMQIVNSANYLDLNFTWSVVPEIGEIDPEADVDFDIYIFDEDGEIVNSAATGDFEHIVLETDLEDGTYEIAAQLYAASGKLAASRLPITTSVTRCGTTLDETIVQPAANALLGINQDANGVSNASWVTIGGFVKSGNSFTFLNDKNEEVFQGRKAPKYRNPVKQKVVQK